MFYLKLIQMCLKPTAIKRSGSGNLAWLQVKQAEALFASHWKVTWGSSNSSENCGRRGKRKDLLKVHPRWQQSWTWKPCSLAWRSVKFSAHSWSSAFKENTCRSWESGNWFPWNHPCLCPLWKVWPLPFGELHPSGYVHIHQFVISVYVTTQLWFHKHKSKGKIVHFKAKCMCTYQQGYLTWPIYVGQRTGESWRKLSITESSSDSSVLKPAKWWECNHALWETSYLEQEKWDRWTSTERDTLAAQFQVNYAAYNKSLLF